MILKRGSQSAKVPFVRAARPHRERHETACSARVSQTVQEARDVSEQGYSVTVPNITLRHHECDLSLCAVSVVILMLLMVEGLAVCSQVRTIQVIITRVDSTIFLLYYCVRADPGQPAKT